MRADLLHLLADYIEKVPEDTFDMTYFAKAPRGATDPEHHCGTKFCIIGHGCNIPEFKAAGLRLVWGERQAGNGEMIARIELADDPLHRGGFSAICHLLDIDTDQATYLFGEEAPVHSPQHAAERIRNFIYHDGDEANWDWHPDV